MEKLDTPEYPPTVSSEQLKKVPTGVVMGLSLNQDSEESDVEDFSQKIKDFVPNTPMLGKQIANFRIQKCIGKGGFGEVYLAQHIYLDTFAAIKVLRHFESAPAKVIRRFQREAKVLSSLEHRNIVRLIDFGVFQEAHQEPTPYLVMEFLEGITLQEAIKRKVTFPIARLKTFVIQICDALSLIHAKDVIHRDLKPANLIITKGSEQEDCFKILDFGIVSLANDSFQTTQGTFLGTAKFSSPEQISGELELGPSSDLYSFGVILYYLITRKFPFDGKSPVQVMFHQHYSEAPRLVELYPGIHWAPELEAFFRHIFAKNPKDRPQDASTFAQLFEDAMDAQMALQPMAFPLQVTPNQNVAQQRSKVLPPVVKASSEQADDATLRLSAPSDDEFATIASEPPLADLMEVSPSFPTPAEAPEKDVGSVGTFSRKKMWGVGAILVLLVGTLLFFQRERRPETSRATIAGKHPNEGKKKPPLKDSSTNVLPGRSPKKIAGKSGVKARSENHKVSKTQISPKKRIERKRTKKSRKRQRKVRRRRIWRRRKRSLPKRPVVRVQRSICGAKKVGFTWVSVLVKGAPFSIVRMSLRRCSQCRLKKRGSRFCLLIPKERSSVKVRVYADGYVRCSTRVRTHKRSWNWKLKKDDGSDLDVNYCSK